jgi:hypothetical protein
MKRNWQRTLGLLALLAVLLPAAGHCYYDPGEGRWLSRDPIGVLRPIGRCQIRLFGIGFPPPGFYLPAPSSYTSG